SISSGSFCDTIWSLAAMGSDLFAGTGRGGSGACGVYRTTDGGSSWTAANNGLPQTLSLYDDIRALAVSGGNLFAGQYGHGVFRSSDSGKSWTSSGAVYPFVWTFGTAGRHIFAGTFLGGLYRSIDSGMSWTQLNIGLRDILVGSLSVIGSSLVAATNAGV